MSPGQSMPKRAGMLGAGLASFLCLLVAMRWSNGEPLVHPASDLGIVIGAALVVLFFALSDRRKTGK